MLASIFKTKKNLFITGIIILIAIIGASFFIFSLNNNSEDFKGKSVLSNGDDSTKLLNFKSVYVGDSNNISNLLSNLQFADLREGIYLETDSKPYGITVNYNFNNSDLSIEEIENTLRQNATIIFALIDNVEKISFNLSLTSEVLTHKYTREKIQKSYTKDLREYAKDSNTFDKLLNAFSLKLITSPITYTPALSSVPGIRLVAQYYGKAEKIQYSTTYGELLTWDLSNGNISAHGAKVELPLNTPIYWSPNYKDIKNSEGITVIATILDKNNNRLTDKQVNIEYDSRTNSYTVTTLLDSISYSEGLNRQELVWTLVNKLGNGIVINSSLEKHVKLPDSFDETIDGFEIGAYLKDGNEKSKKLIGKDFSEYLGEHVYLNINRMQKNGEWREEIVTLIHQGSIVGAWKEDITQDIMKIYHRLDYKGEYSNR